MKNKLLITLLMGVLILTGCNQAEDTEEKAVE